MFGSCLQEILTGGSRLSTVMRSTTAVQPRTHDGRGNATGEKLLLRRVTPGQQTIARKTSSLSVRVVVVEQQIAEHDRASPLDPAAPPTGRTSHQALDGVGRYSGRITLGEAATACREAGRSTLACRAVVRPGMPGSPEGAVSHWWTGRCGRRGGVR
jgi:hypothetical protein